MEENPSPWFSSHKSSKMIDVPDLGQQNINPRTLPPYDNRWAGSITQGFGPSKFLQNSALNLHLNSMNLPTAASTQKRFLIFDQSGDHTSLIFSSVGPPFWIPNIIDHKTKAPNPYSLDLNLPVNIDPTDRSNETNVSNGDGGDEVHHEDTDEIDALLYSGSEDYFEEEEASTGHYPPVELAGNCEGVASSGSPRKRSKPNDAEEMDESLLDTASSARTHPNQSYVKKGGAEEAREEGSLWNTNSSKRLKREKIQEIMGALRRIIPGGKGKDATVVLDEAIEYLQSLKTGVQSEGATTV